MQMFSDFTVLVVLYSIILGLGAFAGIFSERAGIINIGIEGIMSMGALGYAIGGGILHKISPGNLTSGWLQFVLFGFAIAFGILFSCLHGFATIKLKSDHTISGVALNILALGVAVVLLNPSLLGDNNKQIPLDVKELVLDLGDRSKTYGFETIISLKLFIFIGLAILAYVLLNKTSWGLRFKAVGENPQAVDVAGLNVYKFKWQGIILTGVFAGVAGGIFAQNLQGAFTGTTLGLGFLALAVMIMGHWNIGYVVLCAIGFSLFQTIGTFAVGSGFRTLTINLFKKDLDVYGPLFQTIPYIFTIVALVAFSKLSPGPAAAGINYDKSKR
ncbi:ABC transporter permease [Mycoplasmopsis felifaucium]|uniref:ABC transporter permease n=1 Tax=Mycoplasmopsis felifaucium TaxID=35768 RepID=A0ABZ2RT15_9BACT|nr:ABC transporter permease [Mycoplasmopsis felifaucium]